MDFEIHVNIHFMLGPGNIWRQEWALHLLYSGQVHVLFLVCEAQPGVVK